LPDKIHMLNVSFLVPEMRREYGGCAGNIAYNLKLLGGEPVIMATVGDDFGAYAERLDAQGISREAIRHMPGSYTAQAFITTDLADNQITAFHPGAMNQSHANAIGDAQDVTLGIVSPDGRDGMLEHARQFAEAGIPFVFDPGQGLPMFNGEELLAFLKLADYCSVNDYEAKLLVERTGRSLEELAREVRALFVTLGGEGSRIYADGACMEIPTVKPERVEDPTGCGDAYRAGLLFGISRGFDWRRTGQLASLMGALKIESRGGQNHAPSREDIAARYLAAFGENLL
ncbi:MAG: carbohydrate kinase family protein, partial [Zoogloea sp.]|nr:carbohydrate kinase family protein [Zoogloea sp.]